MRIHINTQKWLLILFALIISLSACEKVDEFLEERPSKTTSLVVTTADQLDALLSRYAGFYTEGNRTPIYSTDDYELTLELYNARPATFSMAVMLFGLWDIENLPFDGRQIFWRTEWNKIFHANLVLSYLDRVTGTAEQKAILKADAHLVRAYSLFQLANTYCLPYTEANKNELGLPSKKSTSFEEDMTRQTLETTYQQIEEDLEEALKITLPLVQNGVARHWRANKAAANGFAARYWLHRHDYNKALTHAEAALADYNVLVDYNTEMRHGIPRTITINPGPNSQVVTLQFPYTHDNQVDLTDMIQWKEFMYFRMLNHESWWYVPSQELLNLYDQQNDLRYQYHMVQHYSYDRGMTNPAYSYPGYVFFFKDRIPSGPTTAEMILIKAECQARLGQVGPAMTTVNQLYSKRVKPGTPALAAANQDQAIRVILEERRRELPFSHRWFDIRRFNNNGYAQDDVELSRVFYPYTSANVQTDQAPITYTLPKNSRRWAVPIPDTEIISSNGVIKQNTY
jgi:starch-binding outer membrane protein, SusD/RagB family